MAGVNSGGTLKILCIHGYRQNAQAFKERTGAFRKVIKNHAELVFISAPNVVPPMVTTPTAEVKSPMATDVTDIGPTAAAIARLDERGWWFSREDDNFNARQESVCQKGYNASLDVITDAFKSLGPFDGVLGFSQGASVVSLLCGQLQREGRDCPFQFDFAILVAGFRSRATPHSVFYEQKVKLPTLHVFGEKDTVIPEDLSQDLLSAFEDPQTLLHPGGHFIPTSGAQKKVYVSFLNQMSARKVAKQDLAISETLVTH